MREKKRQPRATRPRKPKPGKPRPASRRYHHGALHEALIDAADAILTERGVEGFTLREAARRAGVSPAAPTHHFGSAAGLLTEIALLGFQQLTRDLQAANQRGGADPGARLLQQAIAYVRFALAYPGRFQLMFRHAKLKPADERVHAAGKAAYAELESAVRDYLGAGADQPSDGKVAAAAVGAWSLAHGFAQLALDGRFDGMATPGGLPAFVDAMLPAVFSMLWQRR